MQLIAYIVSVHVSAFPNLLVNKSRSFLVKDSEIDKRIKETIVQAILGKRSSKDLSNRGSWKCVPVKCPLNTCALQSCHLCVLVQHSVSIGVILLAFFKSVIYPVINQLCYYHHEILGNEHQRVLCCLSSCYTPFRLTRGLSLSLSSFPNYFLINFVHKKFNGFVFSSYSHTLFLWDQCQ